MVRRQAVILFLSAAVSAWAEDTMTGIFDDSFHTLRISVNDNYMAPPVLMLDSGDELTISFDEITESNSYLRYSLSSRNFSTDSISGMSTTTNTHNLRPHIMSTTA